MIFALGQSKHGQLAAQIDGIDDDFLFGNAQQVGHAHFASGRKSSIVTSILIHFASFLAGSFALYVLYWFVFFSEFYSFILGRKTMLINVIALLL